MNQRSSLLVARKLPPYALRRTWRFAIAAGPRETARRLLLVRAARYSWLVSDLRRAMSLHLLLTRQRSHQPHNAAA